MKIKIEGQWVCDVCGAIWRTYHGIMGKEPAQCESCGARPDEPDMYMGEDGTHVTQDYDFEPYESKKTRRGV